MKTLTADELSQAREGSYYTIRGAGGPLSEWLEGYEGLLDAVGIGKPQEWFQTTGAEVNLFATRAKNGKIHPRDCFPDGLVILLFPLDGLDVGRLAIFKIRMGDAWFDDIISNMRVR